MAEPLAGTLFRGRNRDEEVVHVFRWRGLQNIPLSEKCMVQDNVQTCCLLYKKEGKIEVYISTCLHLVIGNPRSFPTRDKEEGIRQGQTCE